MICYRKLNQEFADYLYNIPSHWKMDRNSTASVEEAVKIEHLKRLK
jgi:hypothetical protein